MMIYENGTLYCCVFLGHINIDSLLYMALPNPAKCFQGIQEFRSVFIVYFPQHFNPELSWRVYIWIYMTVASDNSQPIYRLHPLPPLLLIDWLASCWAPDGLDLCASLCFIRLDTQGSVVNILTQVITGSVKLYSAKSNLSSNMATFVSVSCSTASAFSTVNSLTWNLMTLRDLFLFRNIYGCMHFSLGK